MDRTTEALATLASYTKDLLEQLDDQIDLSHVEEYQQAIEALDYEEGFFKITSVHRDDLENLGFDTSEITDDQMERLAEKMCNDYCEQLFHSSLEILAEDYFDFPKHKPSLDTLEDYLKSDFRSLERKDEITEQDIDWVIAQLTQEYGEENVEEIEKRVRNYYD